jgi:hypothetical protein
MSNSSECDLEQFLSTLPASLRKEFESGALSLTQDEVYARLKVDVSTYQQLREEYQRLLRHIPAKWREYRERESKANAQVMFPANPSGRPRKDILANDAKLLKEAKRSYAQIARQLNLEHGEGTATSESVRALLKSRKRESRKTLPPDETQS